MSFYAFKLDRRTRSRARLGLGAFTIAPMQVQASALPGIATSSTIYSAQTPVTTARTLSPSGGGSLSPSGGVTILDEGSISRNTPGRINPGSALGPSEPTPSPDPATPPLLTEGDQDSDHSTQPLGRGYGWAYAAAAVAVLAVVVGMRS